MDWANILNPPEGQGTVFWCAAVALAAGASLVAAAIVLQVRRLLAGKKNTEAAEDPAVAGVKPEKSTSATAKPAKPQTLEITDVGYKPMAATVAEPLEPKPALEDLLKRLRCAASVLEEMADDISQQADTTDDPPGGQSSEEFEFLFKAEQNEQ